MHAKRTHLAFCRQVRLNTRFWYLGGFLQPMLHDSSTSTSKFYSKTPYKSKHFGKSVFTDVASTKCYPEAYISKRSSWCLHICACMWLMIIYVYVCGWWKALVYDMGSLNTFWNMCVCEWAGRRFVEWPVSWEASPLKPLLPFPVLPPLREVTNADGPQHILLVGRGFRSVV